MNVVYGDGVLTCGVIKQYSTEILIFMCSRIGSDIVGINYYVFAIDPLRQSLTIFDNLILGNKIVKN